MIRWDLGESGGGIGIRFGEGTAGRRQIRLTNTKKYSIKVNCVSITFLLAFEWSGKVLKEMRVTGSRVKS
jgi:hypothetical protein